MSIRSLHPSGATHIRLVAFGGGTGLPVLLSGLRGLPGIFATAVAPVSDDGGSSGRLRRQLGLAPVGDLRRCLAALASNRELAGLFGHRFEGHGELHGHALGNLVLAALAESQGDLTAAVDQAARLLDVRGAVFPAAREAQTLTGRYADGSTVCGESAIGRVGGALVEVEARPAGAAAPAGVIAAIHKADLVVLAPGSLFTSTVAALLGQGTREALARFRGPVVYAANLMTEPGETEGFTVADHLSAIARHAGDVVTDVLVPADSPSAAVVARYRLRGAGPVELDRRAVAATGTRVRRFPLLPRRSGAEARHDPARLARAVLTSLDERARAA